MKKHFPLLSAMVVAIAFFLASINHQQLDKKTACFLMGDNVVFATGPDDGTIDPTAGGDCVFSVLRLCWSPDGDVSYLRKWKEVEV